MRRVALESSVLSTATQVRLRIEVVIRGRATACALPQWASLGAQRNILVATLRVSRTCSRSSPIFGNGLGVATDSLLGRSKRTRNASVNESRVSHSSDSGEKHSFSCTQYSLFVGIVCFQRALEHPLLILLIVFPLPGKTTRKNK